MSYCHEHTLYPTHDECPECVKAERDALRHEKEFLSLNVRRLELKPGDHIVITSERRLSANHARAIQTLAEERFPGHPIALLADGLGITVLGENDA